MTEPAPQIVKSYLAELERALGGVPDEVAREIFAGIVEELSGLDASAAAARIEPVQPVAGRAYPQFPAGTERERVRALRQVLAPLATAG